MKNVKFEHNGKERIITGLRDATQLPCGDLYTESQNGDETRYKTANISNVQIVPVGTAFSGASPTGINVSTKNTKPKKPKKPKKAKKVNPNAKIPLSKETVARKKFANPNRVRGRKSPVVQLELGTLNFVAVHESSVHADKTTGLPQKAINDNVTHQRDYVVHPDPLKARKLGAFVFVDLVEYTNLVRKFFAPAPDEDKIFPKEEDAS